MKLPGTDIEADVYRTVVHQDSLSLGTWKDDPPMSKALLDVIGDLSRANDAYSIEKIGDGVIPHCAAAVLTLLDTAGRVRAPITLWDGMHRHHTSFYSDLFSIMARILRLKENYPSEAIAMIEQFVAAWIDRAGFWQVVIKLHEERMEQ